MNNRILLGFILCSITSAFAQSDNYWQQKADYKMEVTMDVTTYQYKGKQKLVYTNNSPDTLKRVYYHLYNNAFQPGSEMDVRSRTIADPDARFMPKVKDAQGKEVKDANGKDIRESRIAKLQPN